MLRQLWFYLNFNFLGYYTVEWMSIIPIGRVLEMKEKTNALSVFLCNYKCSYRVCQFTLSKRIEGTHLALCKAAAARSPWNSAMLRHF